MTEGGGVDDGDEGVDDDAVDPAGADSPSDPVGVVAFDNTGTLSRSVLAVRVVVDDDRFDAPVPDVDPAHRTALVSLSGVDAADFDTDASLGAVLDGTGVPARVALANTETTDAEARAAAASDRAAPARAVVDAVADLRARLADDAEVDVDSESVPVGVQLVVDLDGDRVVRVVAYTTVPRPGSAAVVDAVRDQGYVPHIVSGDAGAILDHVAAHTGVPEESVHAYQSAADKAATVESLRATHDRPVVMVGDYVNDRLAFDRADRAVLITHGAEADPDLVARVDDVAAEFDDVLGVLRDGERP